jgi:4'-phosphopantetheinyl transferase
MLICPQPPSLDRNIHVWCIDLNQDIDRISVLSQSLSESERQRAAKFIFPIHRDRWIVARGYLRHILSQYLNITPEQIVFNYGAQGKPEIARSQLQFNLSHSHDRAVYGISGACSIGIDIEYIRELPYLQLVDRFFSPTESTIFHSLPASEHQAAFFHAWTQKEAYLKADGTGLTTPLNRIEVSIGPAVARIVSTPGGEGDLRSSQDRNFWQIEKLNISPDYAGAIVAGGEYGSIDYIGMRI